MPRFDVASNSWQRAIYEVVVRQMIVSVYELENSKRMEDEGIEGVV